MYCSTLNVSNHIYLNNVFYLLIGAPDQFTYDEVKSSLESIKGVTHVHSLRLWSLTVDLLAANVHLQIGTLSHIKPTEIIYLGGFVPFPLFIESWREA
jgi:Co/Zn/Cd efflux system component